MLARGRIFDISDTPASGVAIVLGAGLNRDGTPTAVLRDRVATAVELYEQGKVQKVLMSGDNRFEHYNEPEAMLNYALQLGIPRKDIVLDYAGRSTYDTCFRARDIFGVTRATLITQRFHLPRAIFICDNHGIDTVGTIANKRHYWRYARVYWNIREVFATLYAFANVWVIKPLPVLGEPEPIDVIGEKHQQEFLE